MNAESLMQGAPESNSNSINSGMGNMPLGVSSSGLDHHHHHHHHIHGSSSLSEQHPLNQNMAFSESAGHPIIPIHQHGHQIQYGHSYQQSLHLQQPHQHNHNHSHNHSHGHPTYPHPHLHSQTQPFGHSVVLQHHTSHTSSHSIIGSGSGSSGVGANPQGLSIATSSNSVRMKRKQSAHWGYQETESLIKAYESLKGDFESSYHKDHIWRRAAESMTKVGFKRDAEQCRNRWKLLRKRFRQTAKRIHNSDIQDSSPTCEHYDSMVRALGPPQNLAPDSPDERDPQESRSISISLSQRQNLSRKTVDLNQSGHSMTSNPLELDTSGIPYSAGPTSMASDAESESDVKESKMYKRLQAEFLDQALTLIKAERDHTRALMYEQSRMIMEAINLLNHTICNRFGGPLASRATTQPVSMNSSSHSSPEEADAILGSATEGLCSQNEAGVDSA